MLYSDSGPVPGIVAEWKFKDSSEKIIPSSPDGLPFCQGMQGGEEFSGRAVPPQEKLVIWYDRPASKWVEALPIGNGHLGAMIYGGVSAELLQLNEATIWGGKPHSYAEILTRIADSIRRPAISTEIAAGIVLSKPAFLHRVEAILSDRRARLRRLSLAALATICAAALVLSADSVS